MMERTLADIADPFAMTPAPLDGGRLSPASLGDLAASSWPARLAKSALRGAMILKLTGAGIRHKDAVFDPAKWRNKNIFSSMAGAAPLVPLASGNYANPE
jgi:hypothetical protein